MWFNFPVQKPEKHPGQEISVKVSREEPWDSRDPDVIR